MQRKLWMLLCLLSTPLTTACQKADPVDSTPSALARRPCPAVNEVCHDALPDFGPKRPFRHFGSNLIAASKPVLHRSRDVFTAVGQPSWVIAKFSYGIADLDLKDEEVDAYIKRSCGQPWEKIGSYRTTEDDSHAPVDGIEDSGGRVYINLNEALPEPLTEGHYQILLVVAGDHTSIQLNMEVVSKDAGIIVTDVDGTLTSSEMASASSIIGISPEAHPGAAKLLSAFYKRGYFIHYLTARPEWMGQISRDWLQEKKFPPGIINTTQFAAGAVGEAATSFKIQEMDLVRSKTGIVPRLAFGNKPSDVKAFKTAQIKAESSYYYDMQGDAEGGHIHSDYNTLMPLAEQLPALCTP